MQIAASALACSRPRKVGRVAKVGTDVIPPIWESNDRAEGLTDQTRSSTAAMPWPTPTHIATSA